MAFLDVRDGSVPNTGDKQDSLHLRQHRNDIVTQQHGRHIKMTMRERNSRLMVCSSVAMVCDAIHSEVPDLQASPGKTKSLLRPILASTITLERLASPTNTLNKPSLPLMPRYSATLGFCMSISTKRTERSA